MKYWQPGTIRSRTMLVLICTFLLSHAASLAIYEINRDKTILLTEATDLAERIIGVVELAHTFPREDRQRILAAAETQLLSTLPKPGNLQDRKCHDNDFSRSLYKSLSTTFDEVPGFNIRICLRRLGPEPLLINRREWAQGFDVLVEINFPDNEHALFHAILPEGESLILDTVLLYFLFPSLVALLLAGYLARKIVARLIHSQTEMLAAVSHDLRTAVTRLQLRAELLQDRHEREGFLRVVGDMKTMIPSALDFVCGVEPGEAPRKTDLSALAESLCEDLHEEGYPVTFSGNGDNCALECRPLALRRALQNIIDNGIKYGGEAHVSVRSDNENFHITVEDRGPGIPAAELNSVLQPFYRLEKSRNSKTGGVGLGLSIARNAVRAHDGELRLENINGGLRVEILLPRK